jgi:multiple sugar transport system ATP-binding protein
MAGVRLVNVTKRFGKTEALRNVNLEIKDREFFVLAGPPGGGKTTLLRLVAGLEKPDEGEVYIGDDVVNELDPKDRDVSMVFENLALYPNKTAFENIAFTLRQHKTPENEIRKRVEVVARKLLIEHLLDRNPGTFSGGERQRVALARAIIRKPSAYLLDEPLANLDAKIRESMRPELERLARELGTIIYTTHDQLEALALGERVAVLDRGAVQQCGTPEEIYRHPVNKFVATTIGSPAMNLLECTYEEKDNRAYLTHSAFSYDVTVHRSKIGEDLLRQGCTLGVRPQDIRVMDEPTTRDAIEAIVYVAEPLGSRDILTLQIGDDLLKAVVGAGLEASTGDKKYIEFDNDKVHIFEKNTERAIL